ncbi:hypothetical protein [Bifidobacterium pseudocatenulatum]|uniref:hypothetical protein n=1 Tax=Bifidobacterium pseudocatenulatum TaxID=28026 RepID=UPI001CFB0064|nr:hypothetical protein [Bifidobacterium pseudocatenulatum]MCB4906140.1 hypothetical protein [Bifidobacterium pseudocatenulatum]
MSWTSANGREITDEMIDRWRKSYEQGEFPEDERTVGGVIMGRHRSRPIKVRPMGRHHEEMTEMGRA